MAATNSQSSGHREWRALYHAAIFETNKSIAAKRVSEAEEAVAARARELFSASGDNLEERDALEDALYALHAFKSTWQQAPKRA